MVKMKDCISQIHSDLLPKARLFWILQNLPSESSHHNLLGCVGSTSFVRRQVQHYQTIWLLVLLLLYLSYSALLYRLAACSFALLAAKSWPLFLRLCSRTPFFCWLSDDNLAVPRFLSSVLAFLTVFTSVSTQLLYVMRLMTPIQHDVSAATECESEERVRTERAWPEQLTKDSWLAMFWL
jgi:hypothetical protein